MHEKRDSSNLTRPCKSSMQMQKNKLTSTSDVKIFGKAIMGDSCTNTISLVAAKEINENNSMFK